MQMFKKMVLIAGLLVSLNIGTGLAAAPYDLIMLKADIGRIEANKAKIASLESSLNGLKIDSRSNMWNFIGRSGNEKTIQKRSRIVRDISFIKDENSGIAAELLKNREALQSGLAAGLSDETFRYVLDYLNSLAMADALATGFMDAKDISSSAMTKDRSEFLRYKRGLQDIRLRNMEILILEFKASRKACEEAKMTAMAESLDKYILELGNKLAEGLKSQETINSFLK
jgi:hypothetical protein